MYKSSLNNTEQVQETQQYWYSLIVSRVVVGHFNLHSLLNRTKSKALDQWNWVATFLFTCMRNIQINVRENRRGNQEWTIQRNRQHWAYKIQDEDKQNKNTTQNVFYTT